MFYLNNDNIEEMFRDAAEKYQLPTDAAFDWEKVERSLEEERIKAIEFAADKKNKRRRFVIWYLLLILLGWLGIFVWQDHFKNTIEQKALAQQEKIKATTKKENDNNSDRSNIVMSQVDKAQTASLANHIKNSAVSKSILENKISTTFQTGINITAPKKNDFKIYKDPVSTYDISSQVTDPVKSVKSNNAVVAEENIKKETTKSFQPLPEKKIVAKKHSKGLYAGLVFAPDITFIKFQKTSGVGLSVGLIAGYKFNNKWSIESGLLSSSKKYYTGGEYFDKNNVTYLHDKELVSAEGNCRMIEVPLNAKYTIAAQKKGRWTATVGVASYFMNKESYTYDLIENGQPEQSAHTYYHSDHNITAVLNFAAGYQRSVGKGLELRLEPYYKLPLNGMGTGNLYLSSTGLNIGITKSFH